MIQYSVTIPQRVLAALRREAAAATPAECCGGLFGAFSPGGIDVRCGAPVPNGDVRTDRYAIDAETVLRLDRRACSAGLQLVGFYHSHPVGPATPSAADLEDACPGFLYLIVQSDDGEVRGWRLNDDRGGFTELPVRVAPTPAGAA